MIEDVRRAQRAHQCRAAGTAHPGDLRVQAGRELHGEGADAAARPVDQHPLSGPYPAHRPDAAQRGHRCHRHGRGLGEGQAFGLGHHPVCRGARVLGERAPAEAQYRGTGPEPVHPGADRLHHPGGVDAGHPALGTAQPHPAQQAGGVGVSAHHVPVVGVDRGALHPDQYLADAGPGPVGLPQPQDVRRTEPLLEHCPHRLAPSLRSRPAGGGPHRAR